MSSKEMKDTKQDIQSSTEVNRGFFKNKKTGKETSVLRLKKGEALKDGVTRLTTEDWDLNQPYVQQGRVLRSVQKQVKGITKNLKPGTSYAISYSDITDSDKELDDVSFTDNGEYVNTKGPIIIFKVGGKLRHYPISVIREIK